MYLGLYSCSPAKANPGTPDKRDAKRRRHAEATCEEEDAAADALTALAKGQSLPSPPGSPSSLTYKKRLCFVVADQLQAPAVVAAAFVHQLGAGRPFAVVAQALDSPQPLRGRRAVPISKRAAEYVRNRAERLEFHDFATPETPPELNDIFEALQKSGNLQKQQA